MNSILFDMDGFVCVAAENAAYIVLPRVLQSASGDLRRHAQPTRIQTVDKPHDRLAFEIQLLQFEI